MRTTVLRGALPGGLLLALLACTDPAMPDRTDGAAFFAENCVSCHGPGGRGDGPLANLVSEAPPDLTTLSPRNGGTFPAAQALSFIYGGPYSDGHLARIMPEFGERMTHDLVPVR
ncbi:Cytochrome C oxidase, cbb3-type, subunit III [Roseivivax sediminis]|uniref:Cytochrome C oxidase, cbb3-type, subunit III n=2 Tax=Roseivivax sediminis TaxID=936889 RepID=A0A1I1VPK4_9RHOB|nr:Cytochrome C oxidase, cbb3-type, subunit III [Roseivivax sediminis]